ncbi:MULTISPECIES: response regulator [Asticcacaulis]|uniref:response regulator n=1 Tax=Asticcacaulis TaxID=76890 RepID=UPI001AE37C08|nr:MULTISPECIES: response regulator [Asticcacaulis]MBP2159087.1 CheY-like chemotaxis protein [Asticcacaulis solisilvae]MDR6800132.1 CheY-like chemotaxis protein [Asticcacaulis sp. BE141]
MTSASPTGLTVIIVDDDRDTTQTLHWLLELDGHNVHSANTADAAMDLINHVHPDVVLLDLMMPYISGFDLHRRMQAHPNCQVTRFIAHSGMGEAKTVNRIVAEGFDAHILKPPDHAELLELIETVITKPAE